MSDNLPIAITGLKKWDGISRRGEGGGCGWLREQHGKNLQLQWCDIWTATGKRERERERERVVGVLCYRQVDQRHVYRKKTIQHRETGDKRVLKARKGEKES